MNGICTVQFCGESTSTIGYGTVHGAMEVAFCFVSGFSNRLSSTICGNREMEQ